MVRYLLHCFLATDLSLAPLHHALQILRLAHAGRTS
jgi:hypothetical protein